MSDNKHTGKALTFHRTFQDDDFGIPQSPPTSSSPWKLTVHRDTSPTRMKAKTPEPSNLVNEALSVPDMVPNLSRRASCPNFTIPEFSVPSADNSRLVTKRPSIISQAILDQFKPSAGFHGMKGGAIDETPELTNATDSPCAVALTEKPMIPSVAVTGADPVMKKQTGFLASRMASYFKADIPDSAGSPVNMSTPVEGVASAPSKKKSYLMKRAAAMTNSDVNAMAPSSM